MPLIFRAMKMDGAKPLVASSKQGLGVKIGPDKLDDLDVGADGNVHPHSGGMSVGPTIDLLPMHRVPQRLRDKFPKRFPAATASDEFACWWMGEGPFMQGAVAERLSFRPDPQKPNRHGFVEPDTVISQSDYESALAATQDQWRKWEG